MATIMESAHPLTVLKGNSRANIMDSVLIAILL